MLNQNALRVVALACALLGAGESAAVSDRWPAVAASTPWTVLEATGCPDSGSYEAGTVALGTDGAWCVCVASGSPGDWVLVGPLLAADVPVADAGELLVATDVEAALAELATAVAGAGGGEEVATVTIAAGDGAGSVGQLHVTPLEVIPAPDAGYWIRVTGFAAFLDWQSAAYDGNTAMAFVYLRYTDGSGPTIVSLGSSGFWDATADAYQFGGGAAGGQVGAFAAAPVVVHSSEDLYSSAGDSPVYLRVTYVIEPLPAAP